MDSVALKIEGFFSLLIAASGGGGKIAYFCLGVHLFLKLFNSVGVRNVHLRCGNDQAAKSAWRRGMTKVYRPDAAPCTTLWHGEGCSHCFCSGALTPFPGRIKIWDCTWRPVRESPWEPELPGNAVLPQGMQKHIVSKQNISSELPSTQGRCTTPLHWAGWLSLGEAAVRRATWLQDMAMRSSCPNTPSYREGGGAASLFMEVVFAAYPILLMFMLLLHF